MGTDSRIMIPAIEGMDTPPDAAGIAVVTTDWAQQGSERGAMQNQRSKVMIKNDFQHRLILSTLLITLITLNIIITGATMLDYLYGESAGIFNVFTVSVAVMELLAVAVVYFVSRRISFHIAGPVYAIERTLNSMNEGDVALRLKLRDGDHFTEVADAINDVLGTYQNRIGAMKALVDQEGQLSPEQQRELAEQLSWFVTRKEDKG